MSTTLAPLLADDPTPLVTVLERLDESLRIALDTRTTGLDPVAALPVGVAFSFDDDASR